MRGTYNIVVDGEEFEVLVRDSVQEGDEQRVKLWVGGQEHLLRVKIESGEPKSSAASKPAASVQPRSHPISRGASGDSVESADAPGVPLAAPMAGRIVAVNVMPGQRVARGEALLVLEAMKMESTVSAPDAGVILAVSVSPGDTVRKGSNLCSLQPSR